MAVHVWLLVLRQLELLRLRSPVVEYGRGAVLDPGMVSLMFPGSIQRVLLISTALDLERQVVSVVVDEFVCYRLPSVLQVGEEVEDVQTAVVGPHLTLAVAVEIAALALEYRTVPLAEALVDLVWGVQREVGIGHKYRAEYHGILHGRSQRVDHDRRQVAPVRFGVRDLKTNICCPDFKTSEQWTPYSDSLEAL